MSTIQQIEHGLAWSFTQINTCRKNPGIIQDIALGAFDFLELLRSQAVIAPSSHLKLSVLLESTQVISAICAIKSIASECNAAVVAVCAIKTDKIFEIDVNTIFTKDTPVNVLMFISKTVTLVTNCGIVVAQTAIYNVGYAVTVVQNSSAYVSLEMQKIAFDRKLYALISADSLLKASVAAFKKCEDHEVQELQLTALHNVASSVYFGALFWFQGQPAASDGLLALGCVYRGVSLYYHSNTIMRG